MSAISDTATLRRRLKIGANVLVVTLAVVFYLLALYTFKEDEFYRAFFLGLATNFFNTFILFVVLNYFLSDPDDQVVAKLESLLAKQQESNELRLNESQAYEAFFGHLRSRRIIKLRMAGYSMAHLFQQHREDISAALRQGCNIQVLILDPDSHAGNTMIESTGSRKSVEEPHQRTLRYIRAILESGAVGTVAATHVLEVRKMAWIPSCALVLGEASGNEYHALVGINGFSIDNTIDRRLYTCTRKAFKDTQYQFFETHFQRLWDRSEPSIDIAEKSSPPLPLDI